jgi:hypothetical protein
MNECDIHVKRVKTEMNGWARAAFLLFFNKQRKALLELKFISSVRFHKKIIISKF